MKPRLFRTPEEFRAWLVKNHAVKTELLVGFHKVPETRAKRLGALITASKRGLRVDLTAPFEHRTHD